MYLKILTHKALGNLSLLDITPIGYSTFSDISLALAIHDDVSATGLRDIERVYWIEIPPHLNDLKLEVKGTKLDLANLLSVSTLSERISDFDGGGALGVSQEARF